MFNFLRRNHDESEFREWFDKMCESNPDFKLLCHIYRKQKLSRVQIMEKVIEFQQECIQELQARIKEEIGKTPS